MKRIRNIGGMTVIEQIKQLRKTLPHCHFVHHISHTD
jgi:cobalamin-dependent methionine synthase I